MKIRSAYAFIIFKITDDKKSIVIEHKGEKGDDFAKFCSKLPDSDCRYSVLDVEINTKAGATTHKLIFVAWSDDNASIKPKMLYASSKDALKKALTGINEEYQVCRGGASMLLGGPPFSYFPVSHAVGLSVGARTRRRPTAPTSTSPRSRRRPEASKEVTRHT